MTIEIDAQAGPETSEGEVLYESERTRVVRIRSATRDPSIICKQFSGGDSAQRQRHEYRLLQRLAGVVGVVQLAPVSVANGIALEDLAGTPLSAVLVQQRLEIPQLLDIALQLTRAVAAMHRAGVVHKDINPGNILIAGTERRPVLIDFDLATTFAVERPAFAHHRDIAGTLAYLAPEQTGRTARTVDHRADLYALGATLYELFAGHPPFAESDPLELLHDHLARVAPPLIRLNPEVPSMLSAAVMRLLSKEPDLRYQSADGLLHDLARVREACTTRTDISFELGQLDFPLRLSAPSRLFGRDVQIGELRRALDRAVRDRSRGVFISGAPGVGKTAMLDELRPIVAERRGWFIAGRADQDHRDTSAAVEALRALGRMLLAEPEADLARQREHMIRALGANAVVIAALVPEFSVVLKIGPDIPSTNPLELQTRMQIATVDLLRSIASPIRPLVMVVDDLQWADTGALQLIEALLADKEMRGLLLVGAYRDADVDTTQPVNAALARWRHLEDAPLELRLENLPSADLCSLLTEILRLEPAAGANLAEVVVERTAGNPYDTIELINALRHDGALMLGSAGWHWDTATIRRYIGQGTMLDLLHLRIDKLPDGARQLLAVISCLGGEASFALLQEATGLAMETLEVQLEPLIEDCLLAIERAHEDTVAFCHYRVQQAALEYFGTELLQALHLLLARRLSSQTQFEAAAVAQYLEAVPLILEPGERDCVAQMFRQAAERATRAANYAVAERLLATALTLRSATTVDTLICSLQVEWHSALYCLGRLDEADSVFRGIEQAYTDPLVVGEAAYVQVSSLVNRGRPQEALSLGLATLRKLGLQVPELDIHAEVERRFDELSQWISHADLTRDAQRPEMSDSRLKLAVRLASRLYLPSMICNPSVNAWLLIECQRLWKEHGPCAALISSLGTASEVMINQRQAYRAGYEVTRYVVAVGEARGYEPETSIARFFLSAAAAHWVVPLEDCVVLIQQAREGLLKGGELQYACFNHNVALPALRDSAPVLDSCADEAEAALAFAVRTGNVPSFDSALPYRQLVRMLRGETESTGSFDDHSFKDEDFRKRIHGVVSTNYHAIRGLAAAIFGNKQSLVTHATESMSLQSERSGFYATSTNYLIRALALAERIKADQSGAHGALLLEIDACKDWITRRAADAPLNFLHLQLWIEAERAWALGNVWEAAHAFDTAIVEAGRRPRPWQRALMTERAGALYLSNAFVHVGRRLLSEAQRLYAQWGATAKVIQMEELNPFLRSVGPARYSQGLGRSTSSSSDRIDLIALLRASQALSSETSLDRLRTRVSELLASMTGATTVHVLIRRDDPESWSLWTEMDEAPTSVEDAGTRRLLSLSAFRYAQRTCEPLLVDDATHDDRFASDPYFVGLEFCSLLVAPILSHGIPRAVLMLENRLGRSAFSIDRLDMVMLIAGQLAVSLDNALLYDSMERKVATRTQLLAEANQRLELLSATDPLTGLANRRRFDEILEGELRRALRTGSSFGAAMIDIDHFKSYNDRYGHIAGDSCLRRVATTLGKSIRQGVDLAARYGGEEFAFILPGADEEAALTMAERGRAAVEALNEPHSGAERGIVTVSIGVAAIVPTETVDAQQIIALADAALYDAKDNGRNQVCRARRNP